MKNMMEYKGYFGSVEYSDDDKVFHGQISFIRGLVTYEADGVKDLRSAFEESVDDYLEFCKDEGKDPEKPFRGSFNIRVGEKLHRSASIFAQDHEMNLNHLMTEALTEYLKNHSGNFTQHPS